MQINFLPYDKWGEDSWCIQDYRSVTGDTENRYIAGLILFDSDTDYPQQSEQFIDMAAEAGAAIIVVETCWLSLADPDCEKLVENIRKAALDWGYVEHPETYETKLTFFNESEELTFEEKYNILCDKLGYEEGWDPREEEDS
jgi:hypothetical protein